MNMNRMNHLLEAPSIVFEFKYIGSWNIYLVNRIEVITYMYDRTSSGHNSMTWDRLGH